MASLQCAEGAECKAAGEGPVLLIDNMGLTGCRRLELFLCCMHSLTELQNSHVPVSPLYVKLPSCFACLSDTLVFL